MTPQPEKRSDGELDAMAATLRANGYRVVKEPACKRNGGHGSHSLRVVNIKCPGVEPIPHGIQSGSWGTFAYWINCQCGHSFSTAEVEDGKLSPWGEHCAEFGIQDRSGASR